MFLLNSILFIGFLLHFWAFSLLCNDSPVSIDYFLLGDLQNSPYIYYLIFLSIIQDDITSLINSIQSRTHRASASIIISYVFYVRLLVFLCIDLWISLFSSLFLTLNRPLIHNWYYLSSVCTHRSHSHPGSSIFPVLIIKSSLFMTGTLRRAFCLSVHKFLHPKT